MALKSSFRGLLMKSGRLLDTPMPFVFGSIFCSGIVSSGPYAYSAPGNMIQKISIQLRQHVSPSPKFLPLNSVK